jgi:SAM-dependent methyltransferase
MRHRHKLYEESVQDTETTIGFIETVFKDKHDKFPLSLREDFCGTALLCADWVRSRHRRRAVGLDIDAPTLAWGRQNNIKPLGKDAARVELLKRDVLDGTRRKFDVIVGFNFSYWIFKERQLLKSYFARAKRDLKPGGVFIIDLHGGPDAQFALEEGTDCGDFEYVWEQECFNPMNNHTICHIHYRFPDGGGLKRAFTYDWRVWSLPELGDLLREAGFSTVDTWWDGNKEDEMVPMKPADENFESWLAYLVAWK